MSIKDNAEKSSAMRAYVYCISVVPTLFSGLVFRQLPHVILVFAAIALGAALATRLNVIFRQAGFVVLIFLGQATVLVASYLSLLWRYTDLNGVAFVVALPLLVLFGWLSFRGDQPNRVR